MWLQFRANFAGRYIEMRMRRVHLSMRAEGIKASSKRIRRCSVNGRKRYENDKCGRKYFWRRGKAAPFSFENGLVWTGPMSLPACLSCNCQLVRWESNYNHLNYKTFSASLKSVATYKVLTPV